MDIIPVRSADYRTKMVYGLIIDLLVIKSVGALQCQGASTMIVGGIIKALTVKEHTCNKNVIGYYLLLDTLLLLRV